MEVVVVVVVVVVVGKLLVVLLLCRDECRACFIHSFFALLYTQIHLKLGRLLQSLNADTFVWVSHLNLARSLLSNKEEVLFLARANTSAMKKAVNSMAFGVANEHIQAARNALVHYFNLEHPEAHEQIDVGDSSSSLHIPDQLLSIDADMCFDLSFQSINIQQISGNLDIAEEIIKKALMQTTDSIRKARLILMWVMQETLKVREAA